MSTTFASNDDRTKRRFSAYIAAVLIWACYIAIVYKFGVWSGKMPQMLPAWVCDCWTIASLSGLSLVFWAVNFFTGESSADSFFTEDDLSLWTISMILVTFLTFLVSLVSLALYYIFFV